MSLDDAGSAHTNIIAIVKIHIIYIFLAPTYWR
jgi:hypothetical protein